MDIVGFDRGGVYLYDNETMIVYDSFQDNMYISHGWKYDCRNYYHFWLDGSIPVRRYYEMSDNRDVVIWIKN